MKKNFKFMLVALLAFVGFNSASAAIAVGDALSDDNYYYEVKTVAVSGTTGTGTVYITKFNSAPAAAVVLPNQYVKVDAGVTYTFKVTGIADQTFANAAFKDQTQITSVKVPSSFEYIGQNAFAGCTNLATIDLTEATGLKNIADQAFITIQVTSYDFSACTKLVGFTGEPFVQVGKDANSFIESITLPISSTFKTIGTALSKLPNLATQNIKDTKIQSVAANAFTGDKLLTALELPTTVKTIATGAFAGSKVADLTINVDAIDATNGIQANVYPAADKNTLTKLTLKGTLKGKIAANAFVDHVQIANGNLILNNLNFGTNASIMANAFGGLDLIESITLGNIGDNGSAVYTIQTNAFNGDKLTSVSIGDITAPQAIGAHAFDDGATPTLTSVTLNSVKSGGLAIAAGAFNFAAIAAGKQATVTIGAVRAQMLSQKVFGAGAFTFNAGVNAGKAVINIGAIESAGSVFTAAAFANCVFAQNITLNFKGDIEYNGIDVAILDDNASLTTLNFEGKVGEAGVGSALGVGVFNDMPEDAVINFKASLAEGAVAANAFAFTAGDLALTVNYTGTPDDPSVNPFDQDAFKVGGGTQPLGDDADRFVTLNITNPALKALIADGQRSVTDADTDDDIIYGVILINTADPEALTLKVYQQTGTTTSYGRWYLTAADYANGLVISRRGNDGVKTLSLYTTYVEDDATAKVVNINMQPVVSTDGKYYFNAADFPLVIIAKATGTSADETDIEFAENTTAHASSTYYTDNQVKISASVTTNEQLRDGSGDVVVPDGKDIYFINNPANHKGMSAKTYDFRDATNIYVDNGSFYLIASHYDNAGAARIIWHDGEESATAIMATKKANVEGGVIYNLAGQKVDASYKGIVIMNGKKFIQK